MAATAQSQDGAGAWGLGLGLGTDRLRREGEGEGEGWMMMPTCQVPKQKVLVLPTKVLPRLGFSFMFALYSNISAAQL